VQQGYECTRRYLEELVAARTQRLSQCSRHTRLAGRPVSQTCHTLSAPSLAPGVNTPDRSVLASEQMLVADLLPNA